MSILGLVVVLSPNYKGVILTKRPEECKRFSLLWGLMVSLPLKIMDSSFPVPLQYNPSGTQDMEKEQTWWRYLDKETMKQQSKAATLTVCENQKEELELKKTVTGETEKERIPTCVSSVENAAMAIPSIKDMGHEGLQKAATVCPHCRQYFPSPFHLLEHVTACGMLTVQQACKSNCCSSQCEDAPLPLKFDRHRIEISAKQCIHGVCCSGLNKQGDIKQVKCINKSELPHACAICATALKLSLDFQKESNTLGNNSIPLCEKCGRSCKYCENVAGHKNMQNSERLYQCDKCSANFKQWSGLKHHQYVHNGNKSHVCGTCGSIFKQPRVLEMHKSVITDMKPYVCDVCNAAFKQSSHLKQHKRIHTNETPYACDMCSAAFKQSVHLKQHRRVHTNEKPYACDMCPSAFKQSEHLKQHKRIHTNETPYACDMCSAAFKQSVHLKQHRRIHTNEKPYSCDLCGAAFKQSEHLKLHKRTHTNEKPYACDLCSAAFKQSAHLKQHKRTHAPGKVITQTFCQSN